MQYKVEFLGPTEVTAADDGSINLAATFELTPQTVEPPVVIEPPPIEPEEPPPVIEPPPTQPVTKVIKAGTSATEVQALIDRAAVGDVYQFEQGEWSGQFKITRPGLTLVGPGATFIHPDTNARGCFQILANGTTLDGMTMRPKPGVYTYGLIQVGLPNVTSLDDLPSHVTLRNLILRGDPKKGAQRAITFECVDSSIDNIDCDDQMADVDAQCIWWLDASRISITNSKFRASGQCILIGGSASSIKDHTSNGIVISKCDFRGREGKMPDGSGRNMLSKYVFEAKRAQNLVIKNCDIHDLRDGVNAGTALGFTVRTERARNPWAVLENIQVLSNRFWNVGRMINALGRDYNSNWQGTFIGLKVYNNLYVGGGPPTNFGVQLLAGVENIEMSRNTLVDVAGNLASSIYLESPPTGPPGEGYVAQYPMKNMNVAGNILGGVILGRGCGGAGALKYFGVNCKVVNNVFIAPASMGGNQSVDRAKVLGPDYGTLDPYTAFGSDLRLPAGVQFSTAPVQYEDEILDELSKL